MRKNEPLISGLIVDEYLSVKEILQALVDGKHIRNTIAPKGVNFYLDNNEIKSDKIGFTKNILISILNPDIKFVIDD